MIRRPSQPARMILAALLRDARAESGLRQIDIAHQLDQPQSYVSKYESGERSLNLIELHDLCQALGLTLTDLVQRFEEELQ